MGDDIRTDTKLFTPQHRVDDGRVGPCLVCIAELSGEQPAPAPKPQVHWVETSCTCLAYPFPHLHREGGRPRRFY